MKMPRIKVRGHYREITRDEKGQFMSVKKWSSKQNELEYKVHTCRKLREKYPDAGIGFFYKGKHYCLNEVLQ